ncbi:phospholipid phosphatase 2-like isoform X2 [Sitophilus oryzae]|uniref:Phospholipid phosphatase 2-like isoform X2 n=1 Tax=Sitophilus oryzae TaxID=7048 RepID=A0A6J2X4M5_SITOR|nr:phospholipid phosphatase 2-like isoform X2 [Sitophilus oryzae]
MALSAMKLKYALVRRNSEDLSDKKTDDNKAMVTPLPSVGVPSQPNVRINITDPDKANPPTQQTKLPSSLRFRRRIRVPHAVNAVICVLVTAVIIFLELGYIPATKTGFYCKDPLLSYEFKGDTITATTLLVSNLLLVPLVVLFLTEFFQKRNPWQICAREVWYFYKEFITGCALVLLITEVMKALVGEHRPHFFDVCQPTTAKNCTPGEYVETYECTVTKYSNYFMSDTSRSFPSGHSSLSAFVAFFCSYILHARLSTVQTGQIFKLFTISMCVTWALVCSLTRITDKRHHWWDVGVGMLLGTVCAAYSLSMVRRKPETMPRVAMSTTTLLDIKNKDAKSEII